jgi:beta-lactamase class A
MVSVRPAPTATPVPPLDTAGLARALHGLIAGEDGTYAITVLDLNSGQEVDLNAAASMDAASVNKLEILVALYHQVERGKLDLNQTLRTTDDDIQDYGTGSIRYQPVGTAYTVQELARLLIEQSDNTASYMLAQLIGLPAIEALDAAWGLRSTQVGPDVSSAHDAATLLALLYRGRLVSAEHRQQMLDYLSHTDFNDRIPAGLPAGIQVAHKIGNQVHVINDAGIVFLPGRPYVLSIFTADVDEDRAVAVEQDISRTVYDYERRAGGGK